MNREGMTMGLFGLGLGLSLCSVIVAFTFSKVTSGEVLRFTSGTYMITINWVWLSDLFLVTGLGLFVVSAGIPVAKKTNIKSLALIIPISVVYILITAFDVITTQTLIKSGLGNELNPFMALLIHAFGVSYALSLNFAISLFIIIGLIYFTENMYIFAAALTPLAIVRGFVVYNNMQLIKIFTTNFWLTQMEQMIKINIPILIIFSLSLVLGASLILAFPESEEEELRLPLKKIIRTKRGENIANSNSNEVVEKQVNDIYDLPLSDGSLSSIELALMLERFRIKQEVIESLIKISEDVARKKNKSPDQVTLKEIIDELKRRT